MEHRPQLSSLQRVTAIRDMDSGPGYEDLAVITLGGKWEVVVYRNAFKVGDVLVFFKGGSFILDVHGRFAQNNPRILTVSAGRPGYLTATGMFGRDISHGYVQRLETVQEVQRVLDALQDVLGPRAGLAFAMRLDWDRILHVEEWQGACHGVHLGPAPPFLWRPSVPAAHEIDGLFTDAGIDEWYQVTEKLDGLAMTVYQVARGSKWHRALPKLPAGSHQGHRSGVRVGVAVADYDLDGRSNDIYWQAARALGIPRRLRRLGYPNVAVHGELVGPRIGGDNNNNNGIGFPADADHEFYVFAIFNIDTQRFLTPAHTVSLCRLVGLPHVPVLGYVGLQRAGLNLHRLSSLADGIGRWGQPREGIVLKNLEQPSLWFKVDSARWLFEEGGFAA